MVLDLAKCAIFTLVNVLLWLALIRLLIMVSTPGSPSAQVARLHHHSKLLGLGHMLFPTLNGCSEGFVNLNPWIMRMPAAHGFCQSAN